MLIIAWERLFKVVPGLLSDKEFEACVELSCHFTNDTKGVNLSYTWFFLNHKIRHVDPMLVDKTVGKWEAEEDAQKSCDPVTVDQALPDQVYRCSWIE